MSLEWPCLLFAKIIGEELLMVWGTHEDFREWALLHMAYDLSGNQWLVLPRWMGELLTVFCRHDDATYMRCNGKTTVFGLPGFN